MKKEYLPYLIAAVALIPSLLLRDFSACGELHNLFLAEDALRNHRFFVFSDGYGALEAYPPLYVWLLMLGKCLFGAHHTSFAAIFSVVPMLLVVREMGRWTADELKGEWRTIARLSLLVTAGVVCSLLSLRADALMCLFIILSLKTLWEAQKKAKCATKEQLRLAFLTFGAFLCGGWAGLAIPLLSALVGLIVARRVKDFFGIWGWKALSALAVCCGVWFAMVYVEGGAECVANTFAVGKRGVAAWLSVLSVLYMLLPATLIVIGAVACVRRHGVRVSQLQRFLLVALLVALVVLTVSGKGELSFLPIYPLAVYLGVISWQNLENKHSCGWVRHLFTLAVFLLAAASAVVLFLGIYYNVNEVEAHVHNLDVLVGREGVDTALVFVPIIGCVLLVAMCVSLYAMWKRNYLRAFKAAFGGLWAAIFIGGFALPAFNANIGRKALCDRVMQIQRATQAKVVFCHNISHPQDMSVYLNCPIVEVNTNIDALSVTDGSILLFGGSPGAMAGIVVGNDVERVGNVGIVSVK